MQNMRAEVEPRVLAPGPDDWPEQKFRPLAVDFSFNFAALEIAEQEYQAARVSAMCIRRT